MAYQGSCHCGNAKFTFSLPVPLEDTEVVNCNCSICSKNGYLMVYPKLSQVTFHHSDDAVTAYRWASKQFPHYFCATCGTSLYAVGPKGSDMMAVNARTIEGVELEKLKLKAVDGKSI
ncbi:Mss4-like protein [Aspergillus aurantiobrunneus]